MVTILLRYPIKTEFLLYTDSPWLKPLSLVTVWYYNMNKVTYDQFCIYDIVAPHGHVITIRAIHLVTTVIQLMIIVKMVINLGTTHRTIEILALIPVISQGLPEAMFPCHLTSLWNLHHAIHCFWTDVSLFLQITWKQNHSGSYQHFQTMVKINTDISSETQIGWIGLNLCNFAHRSPRKKHTLSQKCTSPHFHSDS